MQIAIDLGEQQEPVANPKAIQKIKLTGNLDQPGHKTMLFILKKVKEIILDFSQRAMRVL